jgi:hypothetical protein
MAVREDTAGFHRGGVASTQPMVKPVPYSVGDGIAGRGVGGVGSAVTRPAADRPPGTEDKTVMNRIQPDLSSTNFDADIALCPASAPCT